MGKRVFLPRIYCDFRPVAIQFLSVRGRFRLGLRGLPLERSRGSRGGKPGPGEPTLWSRARKSKFQGVGLFSFREPYDKLSTKRASWGRSTDKLSFRVREICSTGRAFRWQVDWAPTQLRCSPIFRFYGDMNFPSTFLASDNHCLNLGNFND